MEHLEEIAAHPSRIVLLNDYAPTQAAKAIFEEQMGVDQDMMRKILKMAMSLGGDFADPVFRIRIEKFSYPGRRDH